LTERRRSTKDDPDVIRQAELAFLRKLRENPLRKLVRVRKRSASSSAPLLWRRD
jgi:hypothetical protein